MILRLSSAILFTSLSTLALANNTPQNSTPALNSTKLYMSAFGGGGTSNHFNGRQFGTAFLLELNGGPLAVNAFGELNSKDVLFFGGQLGYQAQEVYLNSSSQWTLSPAAELEFYSMNRRSFEGTLINDNARLPEHDFAVSYPIKNSLFFANAVLNFNHARLPIHPYISFGIGNAIVRNSNANAAQINPIEAGINHYNANTSDNISAFAGQLKLGLSYDINNYVSLFADYRWLYLANTHFIFGSTVYPAHVETSSWQVKLDPQKYNLGNIGIRLNW